MICKKCGLSLTLKGYKIHLKKKHFEEFETELDINHFVLREKIEITEDIIKEITKEYLQEVSVLELCKKYGILYKDVKTILKLGGAKIKTASETSLQKTQREKYIKTVKEKYGVDNVSKANLIKEKKKNTFLKHYGVDNIFKTENFVSNQKETKSNQVKNYWASLNEEDKIKKMSHLRKYNFISKLEEKIKIVLVKLGVDFSSQFHIGYNSYDIKLTNTNILIEVNGDWWHANPNKFKESDILKFPQKEFLAKEIWEKDKKKIEKAKNKNYNVLTLWEHDIKKLKNNELCEFVKNELKKLL